MLFIPSSIFQPQSIHPIWAMQKNITIDVLRTDKVHPVISGNKWFKLQHHIKDCQLKGYKKLLTFGGAYSNHIVATAFATKIADIESLGIIRGEENTLTPSHTLQQARDYGMQLTFVTRENYKDFNRIVTKYPEYYVVKEGGYGILGAQGAMDMLQKIPNNKDYTHIFTAVGTGTTLAGIIQAAKPHQKIIGISVMKNNHSLLEAVSKILKKKNSYKNYSIDHEFHFGGYAKKTKNLINFMNNFYEETNIPTDFVYTAKAAFAIRTKIELGEIPNYSKILFIHTGGLQGNLSLPQKTLVY